MTERRTTLGVAGVVLLTAAATGACSGTGDDAPPAPAPTQSPTAEVTPTPPPRAEPVESPAADACYRISFRQAVSPTNGATPVPCRDPHSAETYAVGEVDDVVSGHLLAVDSARVQAQVAEVCPAALGEVVGGSLEAQRLSMLRAVWFTPSLQQSAAGADWYRCDVVALAGAQDLLTVEGSLAGVLDSPGGRDRFGMCGTANPDAPAFERVPCSTEHSWRAFSVIDLEADEFPGPRAVADAGAPCEDAAAEVAADPLDYEWAFEGPDAEQWAMGQTFVRCWAPD